LRKTVISESATYVITSGSLPRLQRVYSALKQLEREDDHPYFAKEISEKAQVPFSTTRKALRTLLRQNHQNQVFQEYPRGPYSTKRRNVPTYGVAGHIGAYGLCLPRVQNLRLVVEGLCVGCGLPVLDWSVGDVRFEVVFGGKRGKVSATVSCDDGLSYRELCFVILEFKRRVCEVLGSVPDFRVEAESYEFLKDYLGFRLDGLKAVTLTSFMGLMEKIYQKENCLRHEVRSSVPVPVETLQALLLGGVSAATDRQYHFIIAERLERVVAELREDKAVSLTLVPLIKDLYDRYVLHRPQPDVLSKQFLHRPGFEPGYAYEGEGYHLRS
jgi:hypothetical protein